MYATHNMRVQHLIWQRCGIVCCQLKLLISFAQPQLSHQQLSEADTETHTYMFICMFEKYICTYTHVREHLKKRANGIFPTSSHINHKYAYNNNSSNYTECSQR
uniref:Uncharacterized protein n=1 Tax=Bactrocera dorsalis TaxID=27457 RepID=A0A034WL92_BACDO